jgi:hypothetical protein
MLPIGRIHTYLYGEEHIEKTCNIPGVWGSRREGLGSTGDTTVATTWICSSW